jgi:aquaporin Z
MSQDHAALASVDPHDAGDVTAPLLTRLAAEAAGTFIIVLGILATATFAALVNASGLAVALVAGALLAATYASFGRVSGGHFNPAVTLGSALAGRSSWGELLPYWLAQFVGAAVSAVVVWAMIPHGYGTAIQAGENSVVVARAANGFGANSPVAVLSGGQIEFSLVAALLVEVIAAAVLVGVFLAVTKRVTGTQRTAAAGVLGVTFAALFLIASPVTNAGLNPARSLAAILFADSSALWRQYWLFFVAPIVGAALAALFTRAFGTAPAAPSGVAIETIEETYEIAPSFDDVASDDTAAVAAAAADAATDTGAADTGAADTGAADTVGAAETVGDAPADDVTPPQGSTPEKPQA